MPQPSPQPKRILIIDDEWMIQRVLEVRLRSAGFVVESAGDGSAGLTAARERTPDVVLLDVRMPEMDGFEVMRCFKRDARLATIPVIFISANVLDTVKHAAMAAGATGFLAKPYEPKALFDLISEAIAEGASQVEVNLGTPVGAGSASPNAANGGYSPTFSQADAPKAM